MPIQIGVNNVARNVKDIEIGVNNVARKVKSGWIGVNGIARLFYNPEFTVELTYPYELIVGNSTVPTMVQLDFAGGIPPYTVTRIYTVIVATGVQTTLVSNMNVTGERYTYIYTATSTTGGSRRPFLLYADVSDSSGQSKTVVTSHQPALGSYSQDTYFGASITASGRTLTIRTSYASGTPTILPEVTLTRETGTPGHIYHGYLNYATPMTFSNVDAGTYRLYTVKALSIQNTTGSFVNATRIVT